MIFLDLYLIISKCMFHSKTKRQTDKTQRSSLTLRRIQCYVYVQNRFIHTQFTKKYKRNSGLPKNSSQWREFLTNFDCRAQLVKLAGDGAQFPFIILMTGTLVCLLSVTGEFGVSTNNSPRLWTWTLEQYSIVSLFTHQSIFSTLLIQCLLNLSLIFQKFFF